jgi:hypothetical protein
VYAELGKEQGYDPPEGVKPQKGKKFHGCTAYFAQTSLDLQEGLFEEEPYCGAVIVYFH